jgi:hypothetical protein
MRSPLMDVAFKRQSLKFTDETGPESQVLTFTFPSRVKDASAALAGYRFEYSDAVPRGVDVIDVKLEPSRSGSTVQVRVEVHFADPSRDDKYSGRVDVLVIAEL